MTFTECQKLIRRNMMNKELRNGLEIAANYYYLREEALIELTLKEQQYEKKKKYYLIHQT